MAKEKQEFPFEENEQPKNPMQQMTNIYLPKEENGEDEVFVSLNGKGWLIKRGQTVTLPVPVYDVLMEAERNKERRARYIRERAEAAQEQRFFG